MWMLSLIAALLLIPAPAWSQARATEADEVAALEALLLEIVDLGGTESTWALDSNVTIRIGRIRPVSENDAAQRDSAAVDRILGPLARVGGPVDSVTRCPLAQDGLLVRHCEDDDGAQEVWIGQSTFGSTRSGAIRVLFEVSVYRVGPKVDSAARAGRSWLFPLERQSDGRYQVTGGPRPLLVH